MKRVDAFEKLHAEELPNIPEFVIGNDEYGDVDDVVKKYIYIYI